MIIKEDGAVSVVPVTTTANAGDPLNSPKLPIGKQTIFRRASILIDKKKKKSLNLPTI